MYAGVDQRHFWGFDGSTLDVVSVDDQLPEDKLLLQFVSALAQYCCVGLLCDDGGDDGGGGGDSGSGVDSGGGGCCCCSLCLSLPGIAA